MTSSYNMSRDFKSINIAILTVSDTRTSSTDKSGKYLSRAVEHAGHNVIHKLIVKDEMDEIKICIAYKLNNKEIDYLPAAVDDQLKVEPIYKTFKGWNTPTKGIKKINDLPENAKIYIKELEKFIETKISSISTSPERNDTILIEDPFKS